MTLSHHDVQTTTDRLRFRFVSTGLKGRIEKLVEFSYVEELDFWNLGFGDFDPSTNRVDDQVVSDNGDGRKVLATVAFAVQEFFETRPATTVFFTGSTDQRTRVYGWAIAAYWQELATLFEVQAITVEGNIVPFSRDIEVLGYLIKRR